MYNKTPVYIAACLGMAFFGIAFIVMGSVLPSLTVKYDLSLVQASSLVTFLPVGVLLGSLIFGPIVDRFGYQSLLISSTFITLLGLEGLSFPTNLYVLRLFIFCVGFGGGMLNGSTNSLVSDIYDSDKRSSRLSILGAFYGVGALVIPILLGALSEYYSFEIILRGTGIFMLGCIVYFLSIKFPKPKFEQNIPVREMFKLAKQPLILMLSFFLFFQSGLEGLFNNWTTTYLEQTTSIQSKNVVMTLTFFILGITISRLVLSKLLNMIRHFTILIASAILTVIGIWCIHFSSGYITTCASLFLCGFGLAAGFPVMISLIGSIYKNTTGTAIGLALFIALSGNSILNHLMGYISHYYNINSFPIFLTILLLFQAIIIFSNKKIINSKS